MEGGQQPERSRYTLRHTDPHISVNSAVQLFFEVSTESNIRIAYQ